MEAIDRRSALKLAAMATLAPGAMWLSACSKEETPEEPDVVPAPEPEPEPEPDAPEATITIDNVRDFIVGVDEQVEIEDGGTRTAICFDNAATTPAFVPVLDEVSKQLRMYGSIGRGFSPKSDHSTNVFEETRQKVLEFFNADWTVYNCFYCTCATDGLNKLATALIDHEGMTVLATRAEHHSNDLPWRALCNVIYAEVDEGGHIIYEDIERLLSENKVDYVTITAASNVTGFPTDVHRVAKMAHAHGAKIIVDGAQIVAHRAFSMAGDTPEEDIDFFAFSAHKMYAPFGGGAVIGPWDVLNQHMPTFYGGGIVTMVSDDWANYKEEPYKYEAGSPNYLGVVAMGKAMDVLSQIGFDAIAEHERKLTRKLIDGLAQVEGIILYGDTSEESERLGIVTFNFPDINTLVLAERLSKSFAIGSRRGAFCAHPYVWRLMGIPYEELSNYSECTDVNTPGMVRLSLGIYNTEEEVDELLAVLPDAMEMAREDMEHFIKIEPAF